MKRWFVSQQGKLKGPFTLAQLTAMIPAGSLKPEDMLRPEDGGSPTWASRVPGLFSGEPEPEPAPVKPAPSDAFTARPAAPAAVAIQPVASPAPLPVPSAAHVSAAAATPPPGRSNAPILIAAGAVVGVLLLCVLPVMGLGLMWVFSGKTKKPEDKGATPILVAKQEEPPPEKPKPKAAPLSPKVREAVDKGVAYLRPRIDTLAAEQARNKAFVNDHQAGSLALAGLALLEADLPADDPSVQKVLAAVRHAAPRANLAYGLGTMLFFLNRLDDMGRLDAADRALARSMALRLLAGQMQNGFWTYGNPAIAPQAEADLLQRLAQDGYKPQRGGISNDPSTTQFALLALWGSRRYDLPIDPAIFAAANEFHRTQSQQGTWGYGGGFVWRDSNTCAGLICLAMEKTMREDKKFQRGGAKLPPANANSDDQVAKAFAHLKQAIGRNSQKMPAAKKALGARIVQADSHGDYYFLWSLERVAVIYDLKEIGGHDWYAWGSELLVQHQAQNGSWQETHGDVNDTCFAILFLTRANLAKDLTESIRTRGGKAAIP